jgi:ArsR family transcriptional regulator, arsenate/arsenite/antimonite-responsive transcriptional repressor
VSETTLPVLVPRERVPGGCCEAPVEPDLDSAEADRIASAFKALADPTRLQIVDALRKASPEAICQCELTPLFQISQQALSKHMKLLVSAGVVGSERRGLWTYYFVTHEGLREASAWLT